MKNGPGKFYYLDKGQFYEGTWVNDIPKCGTMKDFGREGAPNPTQYPIAEVRTCKYKDWENCDMSLYINKIQPCIQFS
jgi:hypothetical protein